MTIILPLAALFVIATVVTVKTAGHHPTHAVLAFLAGLFIATTPAGPVIRDAVESLATAIAHAISHS